MINLLFSMGGPRLSVEQSRYLAAFGQWVVLNEREGRLFVDAVGGELEIGGAMQALASIGRAPVIIGGWQQDGSQLSEYPLDENEWLAVAPDEVDTTDLEAPVAARPAVFRDIHRWQGWAGKEISARLEAP